MGRNSGFSAAGHKKMLGVILQAFDIKLRKIAHTSAYKGFAEDGEQIERVAW